MKISSIILAVSGTALAAPAADAKPASGNFGLMAARSGSPIHLQEINANGEAFWIGKKTQTYCPAQVSKCPPGKVTALAGNGDALSMAVEVPGGQQVYIDRKTGALMYTVAHTSANPGDILTGFSEKGGKPYGTLNHKGGFVACPVGKNYQIYVQTKNFSKKGCIGFDALTVPFKKDVAAWEYT